MYIYACVCVCLCIVLYSIYTQISRYCTQSRVFKIIQMQIMICARAGEINTHARGWGGGGGGAGYRRVFDLVKAFAVQVSPDGEGVH